MYVHRGQYMFLEVKYDLSGQCMFKVVDVCIEVNICSMRSIYLLTCQLMF